MNCTDGRATREVETAGPNVYMATVPGLSPYTQYRCCSTARYTNNIEDASACANVVTRQGSKCPVCQEEFVVKSIQTEIIVLKQQQQQQQNVELFKL